MSFNRTVQQNACFFFSRSKMTVDKMKQMKRSQSMWTMSTMSHSQKSNISLPSTRSFASLSSSSFNLADSPKSKSKFAKRFRKRNSKEKDLNSTRYTCPPCLTGDVDAVDSQGRSLLFYAARYGQMETALQLVEAGCSPNQKDLFGNSPLHEAIEKGHLDVAETFLKIGKTLHIPKK